MMIYPDTGGIMKNRVLRELRPWLKRRQDFSRERKMPKLIGFMLSMVKDSKPAKTSLSGFSRRQGKCPA
jgi:hypothetical protein